VFYNKDDVIFLSLIHKSSNHKNYEADSSYHVI